MKLKINKHTFISDSVCQSPPHRNHEQVDPTETMNTYEQEDPTETMNTCEQKEDPTETMNTLTGRPYRNQENQCVCVRAETLPRPKL